MEENEVEIRRALRKKEEKVRNSKFQTGRKARRVHIQGRVDIFSLLWRE